MTQLTLAQSYLQKARKRLKILDVLLNENDYSDVVREAQEITELALKAMLRAVGIDPPKWHDVGPLLLEHASLFDVSIQQDLPELAEISKKLRKEREFSFYGAEDFIPTEEYSKEDAEEAIRWAHQVVQLVQKVVKE